MTPGPPHNSTTSAMFLLTLPLQSSALARSKVRMMAGSGRSALKIVFTRASPNNAENRLTTDLSRGVSVAPGAASMTASVPLSRSPPRRSTRKTGLPAGDTSARRHTPGGEVSGPAYCCPVGVGSLSYGPGRSGTTRTGVVTTTPRAAGYLGHIAWFPRPSQRSGSSRSTRSRSCHSPAREPAPAAPLSPL